MCGICGIASQKPINDLEPIKQMQDALYHRGPDGSGEFYDSNIALSMRRLSIIDLDGGWQPLYNEDHSLVLIANGEIYNFIELRKQLMSRGHRFNTGSDCETILHLYEDYGPDCVHHMRGMFAFALWDTKRRRLMLARDRMGEKPLYLYEHDEELIFASEMKVLLSSGLVPFKLDPSTINLYFHYQYVPEPGTPIKGVRKLPAASILLIDIDPWKIREFNYWKMENIPPIHGDPVKLIRRELERTSELTVRSDVPVGVALSGGLDSSAIAALAAQKSPDTIHAFTVGYPGHPPNDERKKAKDLADYLDIPFHEIELKTRDMVDLFPELVYWRDDPIADISGYGYYSVMKLARKHNVPVMLQGQGGDELFFGYPWVKQAVYESIRKAAFVNKDQSALGGYIKFRHPSGVSARDLLYWVKSMGGLRTGWNDYCRDKASPSEQMVFYNLSPYFRNACENVRDIYSSAFSEDFDFSNVFDLFTFPHPWEKIDVHITRLICQTFLLENGITQGDRLSMASSVELRLPLMDYQFIETIIGLRKSQPDYQLEPKTWFKAAIKDILPNWVINRTKRGFEPPVRAWYQALFETYGSMLEDGYLVNKGILNQKSARELAVGPFRKSSIAPLSFKALVLEIWCRRFSSLSQPT